MNIFTLLPVIVEAVRLAETAFNKEGTGEDKLTFVMHIVDVLIRAGVLKDAGITNREKFLDSVQGLIEGIVDLHNSTSWWPAGEEEILPASS